MSAPRNWKDIVMSVCMTLVIGGITAWLTIGSDFMVTRQILTDAVNRNTQAIEKLSDTLGAFDRVQREDRESSIRLEGRVGTLEKQLGDLRDK